MIYSLNPSSVMLINGSGMVHVVGQLFYSNFPYMCVISGASFPATFVDSQTLNCPLQFTSSNMPGGSSAQGNYIYISHGEIRSNTLSIFFSVPPMITGGLMVSKSRIYLVGTNFMAGSLCQFRSGPTTPVMLKAGGSALNCDVRGITSSIKSFDVRLYAFGQVSNWFTIPVPTSI